MKCKLPKKMGLSRNNKKLFKFFPFLLNDDNFVGLLNEGKNFFTSFKLIFLLSYKKTPDGFIFFDSSNIIQSLILFHFAIELMLKALIALKKIKSKEFAEFVSYQVSP